jgi:predicted metal-binding membrane protein
MLVVLAVGVGLIAGQFAVLPAVAGTIIWQCSPLKQRCLTRCHYRPEIAAFGMRADGDALRFGATHGAWCTGSCWLMMLLPMLANGGHLAVMAASSAWMVAERLERPAIVRWQFRVPIKVARILSVRMGVGSRVNHTGQIRLYNNAVESMA